VDERDFARDESTDQHLVQRPDGARELEDFPGARVRPLMAADRRARDGIGQ
jgi:hypothetical protein